MDRLDIALGDDARRRPTLGATVVRRRRRARLGALVLAGAVLLCGVPASDPSPARASVVQALSLAQLTYKAEEILIARPVAQHARRHMDGKLIVTDVSLDVQDVLKGKRAPGQSAVVTLLGGKLEGLALQVPGEASFELGGRALVFLYRAPHSGDLRVVGMAQGVLPLREDATTTMVLPGGGDAALVDRGDKALQDAQPALSEPRPLADVVRRIRALVAQQAK